MVDKLNRRDFLKRTLFTPVLVSGLTQNLAVASEEAEAASARFFYTSQGKTLMMHADGSGMRTLELEAPKQVTWQPAGFFQDGHRVLMLSMEERRDGPGKPFNEYYHKTPCHIWSYDLDTGDLVELATKHNLAVFYTPQALINDERLLVQVVNEGVAQTYNMKLDGSDAREFTRAGEGMPYGLILSPDGARAAYHLASPKGYQVWVSDIEGKNRVQIAADPDYLFFGPQWSPDGEWLSFQGCRHHQDPGHDWSDLFIARPDGSELRRLTQGQALWFGATYGPEDNRGGGSNSPVWTHDGAILVSKRLPGSKVAWEYRTKQADTDHFNRAYKPGLARGGTEICRIDPKDGAVTRLTHSDPPVWDFRQSESPDGRRLVFCRAKTGGVPAIWVADADGKHAKKLTDGLEGRGADHPRWMPQAG